MTHTPDYESRTVYFIALTSSLGSLSWGYHLSIFNSLRIFLQTNVFPDALPRDIALMASALTLGGTFGALASGKLVTNLGRRGALLLCDALCIFGTCLTTIQNLNVILLGRVIIGITIGMNSSVVPLYNVEMSPLEKKGTMSAISVLMLSLGVLCGFLMGFFVPTDPQGSDSQVWRILFGLPMLFNGIRTTMFLLILTHETPFYLALHDKIEESKTALRQIYTANIEQHFHKVMKDKEASTSNMGHLKFMDLFTDKYRKAFLIGILLTSGIQLCGFSPIFMFFTVFAKESANNDLDTLALFSALLGLMSFISTFITTAVIEKFGRRPLLIFGMVAITIIKLLYILISFTSGSDNPILKYLLVLWPGFYRLTTGGLSFVYVSEVLPGIGVTFAIFINWSCAFLTVQTFFPLVDLIGIECLMLLYVLYCVFSLVLYEKYLIETKGRTKAELLGLYNGSIKEENMGASMLEMQRIPLISKERKV